MRRFLAGVFITFLLALSLTFALAGEKIVILPFDSLAKEDISFIQGVVPKLLSSRLSEMTGLDTVTAEVTSADEAIKTYGPSYLVSGTVTKLGSTYSLDIIVHDPAGERVGGYFSSAQDENGILASLEGLAKDVAKSLPGAKPAEEDVARMKEEAAKADMKQKPEAPPPLPVEEITSAQKQEVAAIQPEAVPEGKKIFTQIKKIETLGSLPGEIYRVAAADVDGDGHYEIAFMGKYMIYLYRFREGKIFALQSFKKSNDHHFLHIDVFDVDGDGLMDFVVTDLVTPFLRSFVVGREDDRVKIKVDDIGWYLSVFDEYKGERRLIGQQVGNDLPYGERAYVMEWDGKKLKKGERIEVPRNEELVMGIIDMNAFSDGGKQRFILMDQYEKLRVADGEGKIFWKSGNYYSGSINFFESFEIDTEMMEKVRFYVKSRMKRVINGDKTAFLLLEAPRPLIGIVRSFPWSRIVLLEWEDDDFVTEIEGEKSNQVITDFTLVEPGDGRTLIVSSVIVSQWSIARKGKSKVVLYEMVKSAMTN